MGGWRHLRRSAPGVFRNGGPFVRARPFPAASLLSTRRHRSFARPSSVDSMKSALCVSARVVPGTTGRFLHVRNPCCPCLIPTNCWTFAAIMAYMSIPCELFVNKSSRCRRYLHQ